MTIIVYRDGVLAVDDMITETPEGHLCGRIMKLAYRKKDRAILAGCGSVSGVMSFLEAGVRGEKHIAKIDDDLYVGVVFREGHPVQEWVEGKPNNIRCDYFAIGTGATMARGALAAGASAAQAAKIVCSHYGWPADLHVLDHDGTFSIIPREDLVCHDTARHTVNDWKERSGKTGSPSRPRPKRNQRKARKPTRGKR